MMIKYTFVKNVLAVAGVFVLVYICYIFLNGSLINQRLQGTWEAIDRHDVITFKDNKYVHGDACGDFKIKDNQILFGSSSKKYPFTITTHYLEIAGKFYLKR